MTHPDFLLLEEMFAKHRKAAFVTCDEACFCWEFEKWLNLEAAQQKRSLDGAKSRQKLYDENGFGQCMRDMLALRRK